MEVHACSFVGVGRCCLFAGDRTVVGAGWTGRVVVQHQHRHHQQPRRSEQQMNMTNVATITDNTNAPPDKTGAD